MEAEWIEEKIKNWINIIELVGEMAKYTPSPLGVNRNAKCTPTGAFFLRVVPNIGPLFYKSEESICKSFFEKIFGEQIPPCYRSRVSVAIKKGGTTIDEPE